MRRNVKLHFLSAIGLAIAVFLAFGSTDTGSSGSGSSSSSSGSSFDGASSSPEEKITPEYRERFAAVSKIFTDLGCRVDPMDPDFPYTMRAYLPSRLAMEMTDRQAREIAGMARSRLHSDAIVYVMSEGGQQLAKAAPWGIE